MHLRTYGVVPMDQPRIVYLHAQDLPRIGMCRFPGQVIYGGSYKKKVDVDNL